MKYGALGLIILNLVFLFLNLDNLVTAQATIVKVFSGIGVISSLVGLYFSNQTYRQLTQAEKAEE